VSDASEADGRSGGSAGGGERTRLILRRGREKPIRAGHPWAFSGAIERREGAESSPLAELEDAHGAPLGVGFHAPKSRIPWRRLAAPGEPIDRAFFLSRIDAALALRREVVPPATIGYRVLNAEGDGLPGWIVDRFGDVLVSQVTVPGLEALAGTAYEALGERFPEAAILHQGHLAARRAEGLSLDDVWRRGDARASAPFEEHGLRFEAELDGGQKTGFYCDQRENRRLAERLAGGRELLDLFAHAGAFSTYALRGGARRATLVESAGRRLGTARERAAANGLDAERLDLREADVFAFLREPGESFGLVVCDPPPFARRRGEAERAARAYKDLNRLAIGRLEPGGHLLTFSCSGAIDSRLFRQVLDAAAAEAGVDLQLLAPLAAAPDHPVSAAHPEGEYLKGWWARRVGAPAGSSN